MSVAYETAAQRIARYALWTFAGLVLVFLVAPIGVIVPLSFSAGSFLHFPLPGLSLRWYEDFFTSELWLPALKNSLIVGSGATVIATALGTLAAFGFWRARFPGRRLLFAVLLSPLVVPVVIVAVGVYFAFAKVGLADGYLGLMLAHAALGSPFVLVTVLSTLAGFDRNLLNAAASLGAPPWLAFRKVALPIIFPGVFSGALFAFATSFDEVVVALLLTGPGQRTLPRQMFAGINDNISLTITAAGTLLVLLACLLLVAAELLRRRSERLRLRPPG
ncbi:ABC transporter permease [Betaproteobacteria bacterium PRO7]|nr:ABC transporter permease [Betaproteobacteria bacterium PRO7]GIL03503.1 MAG: polyamine ABC transporter permease [Betaproteobacteria bacterium]